MTSGLPSFLDIPFLSIEFDVTLLLLYVSSLPFFVVIVVMFSLLRSCHARRPKTLWDTCGVEIPCCSMICWTRLDGEEQSESRSRRTRHCLVSGFVMMWICAVALFATVTFRSAGCYRLTECVLNCVPTRVQMPDVMSSAVDTCQFQETSGLEFRAINSTSGGTAQVFGWYLSNGEGMDRCLATPSVVAALPELFDDIRASRFFPCVPLCPSEEAPRSSVVANCNSSSASASSLYACLHPMSIDVAGVLAPESSLWAFDESNFANKEMCFDEYSLISIGCLYFALIASAVGLVCDVLARCLLAVGCGRLQYQGLHTNPNDVLAGEEGAGTGVAIARTLSDLDLTSKRSFGVSSILAISLCLFLVVCAGGAIALPIVMLVISEEDFGALAGSFLGFTVLLSVILWILVIGPVLSLLVYLFSLREARVGHRHYGATGATRQGLAGEPKRTGSSGDLKGGDLLTLGSTGPSSGVRMGAPRPGLAGAVGIPGYASHSHSSQGTRDSEDDNSGSWSPRDKNAAVKPSAPAFSHGGTSLPKLVSVHAIESASSISRAGSESGLSSSSSPRGVPASRRAGDKDRDRKQVPPGRAGGAAGGASSKKAGTSGSQLDTYDVVRPNKASASPKVAKGGPKKSVKSASGDADGIELESYARLPAPGGRGEQYGVSGGSGISSNSGMASGGFVKLDQDGYAKAPAPDKNPSGDFSYAELTAAGTPGSDIRPRVVGSDVRKGGSAAEKPSKASQPIYDVVPSPAHLGAKKPPATTMYDFVPAVLGGVDDDSDDSWPGEDERERGSRGSKSGTGRSLTNSQSPSLRGKSPNSGRGARGGARGGRGRGGKNGRGGKTSSKKSKRGSAELNQSQIESPVPHLGHNDSILDLEGGGSGELGEIEGGMPIKGRGRSKDGLAGSGGAGMPSSFELPPARTDSISAFSVSVAVDALKGRQSGDVGEKGTTSSGAAGGKSSSRGKGKGDSSSSKKEENRKGKRGSKDRDMLEKASPSSWDRRPSAESRSDPKSREVSVTEGIGVVKPLLEESEEEIVFPVLRDTLPPDASADQYAVPPSDERRIGRVADLTSSSSSSGSRRSDPPPYYPSLAQPIQVDSTPDVLFTNPSDVRIVMEVRESDSSSEKPPPPASGFSDADSVSRESLKSDAVLEVGGSDRSGDESPPPKPIMAPSVSKGSQGSKKRSGAAGADVVSKYEFDEEVIEVDELTESDASDGEGGAGSHVVAESADSAGRRVPPSDSRSSDGSRGGPSGPGSRVGPAGGTKGSQSTSSLAVGSSSRGRGSGKGDRSDDGSSSRARTGGSRVDDVRQSSKQGSRVGGVSSGSSSQKRESSRDRDRDRERESKSKGGSSVSASKSGGKRFEAFPGRSNTGRETVSLVDYSRTIAAKVSAGSLGVEELSTLLMHDAQIDATELELGDPLGGGSYGVVRLGYLQGIPVAVKQMIIPEDEVAEQGAAEARFLREVTVMRKIPPHPNVVQLIGVDLTGKDWKLVVEYCAGGCLLTYLQDQPRGSISRESRLGMMLEAARGVSHLHANEIVHGDLALRNLLLTVDGVVKVSDFGLARHTVEQGLKTKVDHGPLRWMAPESIMRRVRSPESDAWSFGVMMWEIESQGKLPFANLAPGAVAVAVCKENLRLDRPEGCHAAVFALMFLTWMQIPEKRPTMPQIVSELSRLRGHMNDDGDDSESLLASQQIEVEAQTLRAEQEALDRKRAVLGQRMQGMQSRNMSGAGSRSEK